MNRIAFVFTSAPHGSAAGREGLDALLATSALSEDIGVFFIGDGVFQLLAGQEPQKILARDYIATFKVLPLYDIETFWVCAAEKRSRHESATPSRRAVRYHHDPWVGVIAGHLAAVDLQPVQAAIRPAHPKTQNPAPAR